MQIGASSKASVSKPIR